jgi:XTP/dITP diphosphohydrolase
MITFLTGNKWKLFIAKKVFEKYNLTFENQSVNINEIQSEDPNEISLYSAIEGFSFIKKPVIKIDTGLAIKSLNGFPGPYSSYAEKTLGTKGILNIINQLEDKKAKIYGCLTFFDGKTIKQFNGSCEGHLITTPKGDYGYFFDQIFIPEGYNKTLGEFNNEERWIFWSKAYEDFIKWYLNEKNL